MNGITNLDILEAAAKCASNKPASCRGCPLIKYIKCNAILKFCLREMRRQEIHETRVADDELISTVGLQGQWAEGKGGRFA